MVLLMLEHNYDKLLLILSFLLLRPAFTLLSILCAICTPYFPAADPAFFAFSTVTVSLNLSLAVSTEACAAVFSLLSKC